jgi:hypothetical protein
MGTRTLKLAWVAMLLVGGLLFVSDPNEASATDSQFAGCPGYCVYTNCWSPDEGWCVNHCNELCWVCS